MWNESGVKRIVAHQPLLLNVDWLALSVRFQEDEFNELGGGHYFIDYDGTNVWQHRRVIFNQYNEKVATLLYDPKQSIINRNAGLIEIANEWLYHGTSPDQILKHLRQWRVFNISGMSRVDLAVDFNPTVSQFDTICRLARDEVSVGGKQHGSLFWSKDKGDLIAERYQGVRIPHQQSWGHKTTQVKWKLYYKSKELADAMGGRWYAKPYILDCWRAADFDIKDVWRLEVSIKDANQLKWHGEPLSYEAIKHEAREIFCALYSERFTTRENQGHKDKSNDKRVEFLPVDHGGGIRCLKGEPVHRRNPSITLLRHLMASLDDEEILMDDDARECVLQHVVNIVEHADLGRYFYQCVGDDIYSWVEAQRVLADTVRQTHIVPRQKDLRSLMELQARRKWEPRKKEKHFRKAQK